MDKHDLMGAASALLFALALAGLALFALPGGSAADPATTTMEAHVNFYNVPLADINQPDDDDQEEQRRARLEVSR